MKQLMRLPFAILALTLVAKDVSGAAEPRVFVIGLSPHYQANEGAMALREVLLLILERASRGDKVTAYDALNLQPVTQIEIPAEPQFEKNTRARAQRLKAQIVALQQFFTKASQAAPTESGLIQVPQFLQHVGAQLRRPNERVTVILLGSPFYVDAKEPAFNMTEGFYPSDGHIIAGQKKSVYGTASKNDILQGMAIHYGYLREQFVNDNHRTAVGRFWTLFVAEQEGTLASFAADPALVMSRAVAGVAEPVMNATLNKEDSKIQMHRALKREMASAPDWIESDVPAAPAPPPISTRGRLKIGVRWAADVDVDLYVRPRSGAMELYYGRNRSPDGVHNKDFRESPDNSKGYETIEFSSDVDLKDVTAAVNLYAGRSPGGVSGTVRVVFSEQLYEAPFRISSSHGNRGEGTNERGSHGCWQVIDVLKIAGLKR